MQKITAHFLKSFTPSDRQQKHRRDNLQIIVNPSGKVSLSFYYHAAGKQSFIKLGAFKGVPSREFVDQIQAEYSRLYAALTNATGSNLKAVSIDGRVVFGAEAFEAQEFDRQEPQPDPNPEFGALPQKYLEQRQREMEQATFRFAALLYLDQYERTHRSASNETSLLKHLVNGYGDAKGLRDLDVGDIKEHQIQRILDEVARDYPTTAHHVRKCATRLWRWMKRRGRVESREVTKDLEAKEPPPRTRVFTEQEMKVLLTGCHQYYRAVALNPMRLAEHCRVHWDKIDADNNATVLIKGGREHIQPLTDAYIACGRTDREQGGYLLPGRHGYTQLLNTSLSEIGTAWARKQGIGDHHSHDWRSTFATWHERQKTPYDVIDSCLSHQKKGIRKVYGLYQYLDEKREALEQWAGYLRGL